MPGAGAAHREAAEHEALAVQHVATAEQFALDGHEVIDGLRDVGLAGPTVGVVAAPVDLDAHGVLLLVRGLFGEGT